MQVRPSFSRKRISELTQHNREGKGLLFTYRRIPAVRLEGEDGKKRERYPYLEFLHTCYGKVGAPFPLESTRRREAGCPHDSGLRRGLFCRNRRLLLEGRITNFMSLPTEILESDCERVLTLPLQLRIRFSQVVQRWKGFLLLAWRVKLPEWRVLLFQEGRTALVQERHVVFCFLADCRRGEAFHSPVYRFFDLDLFVVDE